MTKPRSEFALTSLFTSGFQAKLKPDEVPPGSAVSGSKNFSVDDDGKWVTRPGSLYFGTLSSVTGNTTSSGKLVRRDGTEIPVYAFGTRLRYLHPTKGTGATPDWATLQTGFTSASVWGFCPNDRNSDNVNKLIMCNGVEAYRIWSGVTALYASSTATTIDIQGSTSPTNLGFSATGSVSIEGQEFAYTGLSATGFTGVTPDPTAASPALTSGDGLTQSPVSYSGNPKGNVLLATDNARTLVGAVRPSATFVGGGQIYGSKTNDPTDFTFSTPRAATDGFILNVTEGGGQITGLAQFENLIYVFKRSCIKRLSFSTDGNDIIQMQSLSSYDERTSSDDGSVSAIGVFRMGNSIIFCSPTNTVNSIQRVEQFDYPQSLPISDAIKPIVDSAVFDTQTTGINWRGRSFISLKKDSSSTVNDMVLVYNQRYACWETPLEGLNIASFFVRAGKLYGTLSNGPDVIQLWTGTSDFVQPTSADIPINAELRLAQQNFGFKVDRKDFSRFYIEGEMYQTGSATFEAHYDENGPVRSAALAGTSSGFFFTPAALGGFGTEAFAVDTFGPSGASAVSSMTPIRFRVFFTTTKYPFYNFQFRILTSSYFKLISYGPDSKMTEFVQPSSLHSALS